MESEGKFEITDPEYSDVVRAGIKCLSEQAGDIKGIMTNISGGRARLLSEEQGIMRVRI